MLANAYINADMDEEEYVKMPHGFYEEKGTVRKLLKALYGHPKSGKLWFNNLVAFLGKIGLHQSERDRCLFLSRDKSIFFIFHVDDFLLAAADTSKKDRMIQAVGAKYKIKEMGFPENFVGFQIYKVPGKKHGYIAPTKIH
jgi:hypothetical protein